MQKLNHNLAEMSNNIVPSFEPCMLGDVVPPVCPKSYPTSLKNCYVFMQSDKQLAIYLVICVPQ